MGRYHQTPQEGDQIFFHNGTRVYHTGYVYKVENGMVYTVEGNTSSEKILENEGGCVAYKQYLIGWANGSRRIDGYGRPDYSLAENHGNGYVQGFLQAADGKRWWYQFADGTYAQGGWYWLTEQTGALPAGICLMKRAICSPDITAPLTVENISSVRNPELMKENAWSRIPEGF